MQPEYLKNFTKYAISLPEFIIFIIDTWRKYLTQVSAQIDYAFEDMDLYHKRNCVNFDQFYKLVENSLRMSAASSFSAIGKGGQ